MKMSKDLEQTLEKLWAFINEVEKKHIYEFERLAVWLAMYRIAKSKINEIDFYNFQKQRGV